MIIDRDTGLELIVVVSLLGFAEAFQSRLRELPSPPQRERSLG
jgi:hypothetical protein